MKFERIEFARQDLPKPTENSNVDDSEMIKYGVSNNYPSFLLQLFNESPIHAAIVNSKATYIIGDGLLVGEKIFDVQVNASDRLSDLTNKVVKDFILFNYFSVEVIYNSFGQVIEYHHIPAQNIRTNKLKNRFWFNESFTDRRNKTIEFDRFNPHAGNTDNTSKIFFFDGYFPSMESVYPKPEYSASLKSITTDIEIHNFNLHNIKNNFSVSTLITMFNGEPTNEIKERFNEVLKSNYTGSTGEKFIVSYQQQNGSAPNVQPLNENTWADAYINLSNSVTDNILRGHQAVSPMLFGIKTEGQLGGASELETSYEIFKNTYVVNKRNEIETALNMLFVNSTIVTGKLSFKDKPLFNTQISDTLKEKIYTINELRKDAGLPPLQNGDRLLNEQPAATSEQFDEQKKSPVSRKLTEEDFELIKDIGSLKEEWESVFALKFDAESDVATFVVDNDIKSLTLPEIQSLMREEGIVVTQNEIIEALENLKSAGMVDYSVDSENRISVMPQPEAEIDDTERVRVLYEYDLKPGITGGKIIDTTRSFCRKLIENNRYYSREDIQQMSSIFGYDVFRFSGGFYFNPETQSTSTSCRHHWVRRVVRPRKNNNDNNE